MKAAFWIWSLMSSSSLKGNVPLRLWTRKRVKDEGRAQQRRERDPPDVDDDAHRPHVQGAVVALVPQDLGGEVGRRAHHRAPEGLLPDDPSEAEVAEFDLWVRSHGRDLSCDWTGRSAHLWEGVGGGQQDVLGFKVTVDDVLEVKVTQSYQDLMAEHTAATGGR